MYGFNFSVIFALILPILVVILVIVSVCSFLRSITFKIMLCPNCHSQAKPKAMIKGSFLIEIVLWLCFIVPGLIYSIWHSGTRYRACPACGETGMIPLDSPRAQQILLGK